MKTAIIIHGMPSREEYFDETKPKPADAHWIPWLKKELEKQGYVVVVPAMPEPYQPNYKKWKEVFEQFPVDEHTTLVGHSCGAGFLVRWISESNTKVGKVVLVAPWIGMDSEDMWTKLAGDFFDFDIDRNLVRKTKGLTIFISSDDDKDMLITVDFLKTELTGYSLKEFTDKGHFISGDMGTNEFPELLEIITNY